MQPLHAALSYIERGWAVLPIHAPTASRSCDCSEPECSSPGKHPWTSHGVNDATTSLPCAREWWGKRWKTANLGIATGRRSGILALDVDPRNGGSESYCRLVEALGRVPETVTAKTGGGGRHYLFSVPHDTPIAASKGRFPGLDLKADGGYIVAAPSRHASGRSYEWADALGPDMTDLAPVPEALLRIFRRSAASVAEPTRMIQPGERHSEVLKSVRGYAQDSRRIHHLWKRAYGMVQRCVVLDGAPFTVGELFDICIFAWNVTHLGEPFSKGNAWALLRGYQRRHSEEWLGLEDWGCPIRSLHPTPTSTSNILPLDTIRPPEDASAPQPDERVMP